METDKKLAGALKTGGKAQKIKQNWQELMTRAFEQKAGMTFKGHTAVIEQVLALARHVLETSLLKLDGLLGAKIDSRPKKSDCVEGTIINKTIVCRRYKIFLS